MAGARADVDVDAIRIFLEVVQRGSFAAVARDRGMEPSSISRMIGVLEDELGFRLLQRTTRRLSLTEAGEAYRQRVASAVEQLESAREHGLAVSAGPAGHLRLTSSVAFGVTQIVPLLPAFRAEFPRITLELVLTDANLDLVAERIDLAIRLAPSVQGAIVAARLMDTHYHVCVSREYLSRHEALASPADLEHRSCLLFAFPEYRTRWLFRTRPDGPEQSVSVRGDLVTSSAIALRDAALLGLGPALLPDWMIGDALAAGTLIDAFPALQATATTFATAAWLLYSSREHLPAKVRVAIDFLKARIPGP